MDTLTQIILGQGYTLSKNDFDDICRENNLTILTLLNNLKKKKMKFVVLQTLIITQICRNDLFLPSTPSATSINCSGISIESVDKIQLTLHYKNQSYKLIVNQTS